MHTYVTLCSIVEQYCNCTMHTYTLAICVWLYAIKKELIYLLKKKRIKNVLTPHVAFNFFNCIFVDFFFFFIFSYKHWALINNLIILDWLSFVFTLCTQAATKKKSVKEKREKLKQKKIYIFTKGNKTPSEANNKKRKKIIV